MNLRRPTCATWEDFVGKVGVTRRHRRAAALIVLAATAIALSGCSSAVPLGIAYQRHAPKSAPDTTYLGVVNGFWRYDQAANEERLKGPFCEASDENAARLSDRHQVRVGIVLLPEGWEYSVDAVIWDGTTVTVAGLTSSLGSDRHFARHGDAPRFPYPRSERRCLVGDCTKVGRRTVTCGSNRCSNRDGSRRHGAQPHDRAWNAGRE